MEIANRANAKTPLPNSRISAGSADSPVVAMIGSWNTIIGHNLPGSPFSLRVLRWSCQEVGQSLCPLVPDSWMIISEKGEDHPGIPSHRVEHESAFSSSLDEASL